MDESCNHDLLTAFADKHNANISSVAMAAAEERLFWPLVQASAAIPMTVGLVNYITAMLCSVVLWPSSQFRWIGFPRSFTYASVAAADGSTANLLTAHLSGACLGPHIVGIIGVAVVGPALGCGRAYAWIALCALCTIAGLGDTAAFAEYVWRAGAPTTLDAAIDYLWSSFPLVATAGGFGCLWLYRGALSKQATATATAAVSRPVRAALPALVCAAGATVLAYQWLCHWLPLRAAWSSIGSSWVDGSQLSLAGVSLPPGGAGASGDTDAAGVMKMAAQIAWSAGPFATIFPGVVAAYGLNDRNSTLRWRAWACLWYTAIVVLLDGVLHAFWSSATSDGAAFKAGSMGQQLHARLALFEVCYGMALMAALLLCWLWRPRPPLQQAHAHAQ